MNNTNRRNFLKSSATVGAGITLTTQFNSTWAGIKGANTDVRAAVIGCGEKGSAHARHLKSLAKMESVSQEHVTQTPQPWIVRRKRFQTPSKN